MYIGDVAVYLHGTRSEFVLVIDVTMIDLIVMVAFSVFLDIISFMPRNQNAHNV